MSEKQPQEPLESEVLMRAAVNFNDAVPLGGEIQDEDFLPLVDHYSVEELLEQIGDSALLGLPNLVYLVKALKGKIGEFEEDQLLEKLPKGFHNRIDCNTYSILFEILKEFQTDSVADYLLDLMLSDNLYAEIKEEAEIVLRDFEIDEKLINQLFLSDLNSNIAPILRLLSLSRDKETPKKLIKMFDDHFDERELLAFGNSPNRLHNVIRAMGAVKDDSIKAKLLQSIDLNDKDRLSSTNLYLIKSLANQEGEEVVEFFFEMLKGIFDKNVNMVVLPNIAQALAQVPREDVQTALATQFADERMSKEGRMVLIARLGPFAGERYSHMEAELRKIIKTGYEGDLDVLFSALKAYWEHIENPKIDIKDEIFKLLEPQSSENLEVLGMSRISDLGKFGMNLLNDIVFDEFCKNGYSGDYKVKSSSRIDTGEMIDACLKLLAWEHEKSIVFASYKIRDIDRETDGEWDGRQNDIFEAATNILLSTKSEEVIRNLLENVVEVLLEDCVLDMRDVADFFVRALARKDTKLARHVGALVSKHEDAAEFLRDVIRDMIADAVRIQEQNR